MSKISLFGPGGVMGKKEYLYVHLQTFLLMELSFAEQMLLCTVRIECVLKDGSTSTGTGFFFSYWEGNTILLSVIVTNKHVIEDSITGNIILSLNLPESTPPHLKKVGQGFRDFEEKWILHPDPNVDLCIMPFRTGSMRPGGYRTMHISDELLPTKEEIDKLNAIEDIIMVGYPNGLWDEVNNFPLIRRGITASHPKYDFNGLKEFVIDAACFPGSSGSPVLIVNDGIVLDKIKGPGFGKRFYLLGILYAGPQITTEGKMEIIDIPTRKEKIPSLNLMMNLGYVIKAERLLDFLPIIKSGKVPGYQ